MSADPARLDADVKGELQPASALPTMKAAVRTHYGAADVLTVEDVPRPTVTADNVLVRVLAAGLDRGAWHVMTGQPYLMRVAGFGVRRPKHPGLGSELAGVVEAVGAEVTAYAVGDPVYGVGQSSFAEYAVAKPGMLARMPSNLTGEQAATVSVSGVTALQALRDQGRVQAGQSVLVIGASGGVGSFAVQLAKAFGAHVTGGLGRQLRSMVLSPFVGQRLGASWIAKANTDDLGTLRAMIEEGSITPAIDRVCPLTDVAHAMRDLAAGNVRGKIAIATS